MSEVYCVISTTDENNHPFEVHHQGVFSTLEGAKQHVVDACVDDFFQTLGGGLDDILNLSRETHANESDEVEKDGSGPDGISVIVDFAETNKQLKNLFHKKNKNEWNLYLEEHLIPQITSQLARHVMHCLKSNSTKPQQIEYATTYVNYGGQYVSIVEDVLGP